MTTPTEDMPPLPDTRLRYEIALSPTGDRLDYTANQMHAYAKAYAESVALPVQLAEVEPTAEPATCKPMCRICVGRGYNVCANVAKSTPLTTLTPEAAEPTAQSASAVEQQAVGQLCEEAFGRGQVMWFKKPSDNSLIYTHPPSAVEPTAQPVERNFCQRCGQRLGDDTHIHTCTFIGSKA